jgi:hypothetical protein
MIERTAIHDDVVVVLRVDGSKGAPMSSCVVDTKVVVVLEDASTGLRRTHISKNIVTDAGDLFYAQRAVGTLPTNFTDGSGVFDGIVELYNGASASPAKGNNRSNLTGLVSGSTKAMTSTYPKINDSDVDNTGAGVDVVTYAVSYSKVEANASNIADIIITNPSPGASEPVMMHAEFGTPFTKTSNDTLKVFINHTLNGI